MNHNKQLETATQLVLEGLTAGASWSNMATNVAMIADMNDWASYLGADIGSLVKVCCPALQLRFCIRIHSKRHMSTDELEEIQHLENKEGESYGS